MSVKLCSATTAEATACRAVALAGHSLCRAHQHQRRRSGRQHRALRAPSIRLSSLHTHDAILANLTRVMQSLASGTLNLDRAAAFLGTIQRASNALHVAEGFPPAAPIDPESWDPDSPSWLPAICFPPHE
jgi:hypothetical protein